jgi:hypothetical protein
MRHKTEFGIRLDQLEASPEMEIYRNLQALSASYRVFAGNYNELIHYLEHLKNPRKSLSLYNNIDKQKEVNLLIDETSRLFHNFIASAKTLVDHTRVIVERLYSNQEFIKEYQAKIDQDLSNNPVQKFVQNLRNYTQHYTLPIPELKIEFGEDIEMSMCLDVNILKQWGGWGKLRSYLETLGDNLSLISLSNEYFALIEKFYLWLTERQEQLHKSDLENLQKMNDELTI